MKPALQCFPFLLLLLLHVPAAASAVIAPTRPAHCEKTMETMRPCLPHLAAVPTASTSSPPQPSAEGCCAAFSAEIGGGDPTCLRLLIRDSAVAGSLIDASRLFSLPSSCGKPANDAAASSFAQICRGTDLPATAANTATTESLPPRDARNGSDSPPLILETGSAASTKVNSLPPKHENETTGLPTVVSVAGPPLPVTSVASPPLPLTPILDDANTTSLTPLSPAQYNNGRGQLKLGQPLFFLHLLILSLLLLTDC